MPVDSCQTAVGPASMDQAILRILEDSGHQETRSLWLQSTECWKCPLVETCVWNSSDQRGVQLLVDTKYPLDLAIRKGVSGDTICELRKHFGERGSYNLTVNAQNETSPFCQFYQVSEPVNSNLPILYVFVVYIALVFLYFGANACRRYWAKRRANVASDVEDAGFWLEMIELASTDTRKNRLRSLDTFRGIAIVLMIFVNLGGGGYYFFIHALWNGLTVADLVFPWFLFIMGTSMYLSLNDAVRKHVPFSIICWHIVRRSVILFMLGLFLNGGSNNNLHTLRIFGVLQRFGVIYFVVGALLCLQFYRNSHNLEVAQEVQEVVFSRYGDLRNLCIPWVAVVVMVVSHVCIIFLLPVPGCPRGYLGPGGLAENAQYENCTGGATGYVDRMILTAHMYTRPTCKKLYKTNVPFDPEGILGLMTATLTVILGVQAGAILVTFSSHRCRLVRWILWGIACAVIGCILCNFSKESGWIPINKNLWSLSYVFVTAATSFVILSMLYVVIDVNNWWNGCPFYQAGMNSIVLYMAHECFGRYLPFSWQPLAVPVTHGEQLVMNAWAASLFVILATYLHYKKIFISV